MSCGFFEARSKVKKNSVTHPTENLIACRVPVGQEPKEEACELRVGYPALRILDAQGGFSKKFEPRDLGAVGFGFNQSNMQPTGSTLCPKCGAGLASPGAECANCLLELGFATHVGNEAEPAAETTSAARVFGDYELLDEIARGGMGVVYRARQRRLGRTVALKLILGGQLATREFVRRFRMEAAAAAALQHPNIVAIHDVGVHDGNHFFSMDYVEGQDLAQLIGNRPLSAQKAAHYMKLIAEAIHYAHEQG